MKRCSRCGQTKPQDEFMWRNKALELRDSYCRPCRAEYKQQHYATNKQRYVNNASVRNKAVIRERFTWLLEYFADNPCADCGETDPAVLEFDHLADKHFNVMERFRYGPWDSIVAEVEKCEVVCANCHRRRTAYRGDFLRTRV